jgi:hypothetical protein
MKIMVNHGSANKRQATPHPITSPENSISNSLRRRAQSVINDRSIDSQSRAVIRYGLETNDPWLAELVRRVDAGETIIDNIDFTQSPVIEEDDSIEEKIEALAEMICRAEDDAGTKCAALFVLMVTLENSTHPKVLANTAKHLAFTRCGELNLYGIVDAQISLLEGELFSGR